MNLLWTDLRVGDTIVPAKLRIVHPHLNASFQDSTTFGLVRRTTSDGITVLDLITREKLQRCPVVVLSEAFPTKEDAGIRIRIIALYENQIVEFIGLKGDVRDWQLV